MTERGFVPDEPTAEFSLDERRLLLDFARLSIAGALRGEKIEVPQVSAHLQQLRGVFTTLHLYGRLRGCIGYVLPIFPLIEAVGRTAMAAAFEDPRFPAVTRDEAPNLRIEISVLTVPQRIAAEEVVVGRHGLLIEMGPRRGLLLPQVPLEHAWDRRTFLDQTCIKAGLPPAAWQQGASIQAFTAEVFGQV